MKIISFDVGIKNMAYCILTKPPETNYIQISDWNVLNLMDEEVPDYRCNFIIPPKAKKSKGPTIPIRHCSKVAKYQKNTNCFCEKHAKNGPFLIPTKQMSTGSLKKMKMDELLSFAQSNHVSENQDSLLKDMKKAELLEKIMVFFNERCYEPIIKKKVMGAGEIDLVKIGRNMKIALHKVLETHQTISHVVIENQISPIANRMKTIQGMLAQYFIMNDDNTRIEFVSSANKLKQFTPRLVKLENTLLTESNLVTNVCEKPIKNNNYKQHKSDGINYCSQILEKNLPFHSWRESMNTKKKDDLADCFLQGLWYLKNKNIITYADDLKINIV
uniref:Mitochondrial resolvase Ydc2 catalytic domain-containing protein n=1 Tax=viral metagenome TaxID=1070528 RepID=A0A6C0JGL8_9ZZZZ